MEEKGSNTFFFALFAVLFLVIFNYSLTLMAGLYIVSELGGSSYLSIYSVSFFAIGNALGVPLGRSLAARVGAIKLLVISLALFMVCSCLCVSAPNYPFFVFFRFLQGVVTGPFYILLNILFGILTPAHKKNLFSSLTLTLFVLGPVLGAAWGGWVAYNYNWQTIFAIDFPLILTLTVYLALQIKKYRVEIPTRRFDGVGYFFYCVGLLAISFVLITGQEFDWFRFTANIFLFGIGIVFFLFFILWSLKTNDPMIDFRLLKVPSLIFSLLNLLFLFATYFGTVILLALWLSLFVNYTPNWIALLLGTMAIAALLPSFMIMHRLGKVDHRIPLAIAILLFGISCFHTAIFNEEVDFARIAYSRVLAGFGLAIFLPPLFRLAFKPFSEKQAPDVVVIFQFVRALGSGLGASLFLILWQRRQVFYHERLGASLTPFSGKVQNYFIHAKNFQLEGTRALSELEVLLQRQATALALDDCFYLMGWIMVGLFILNFLMILSRRIDFAP